MSKRRRMILAAAVLALIALTTTVTARSRNRELIDGLESQLFVVAIPLTVALLAVFVYAAVAFRGTTAPRPTTGTRRLEITWTAVTVLVLLFVGASAYGVLADPYVSPPQPDTPTGGGDEDVEEIDGIPETDDEELVVRGDRWGWDVTYPRENVTTRNEIVIPADENVTMWVTAENVIHSLFVGDLGIKQDAFPGEYTRVRTLVYETGRYDAVCAEFCGAGHARMDANVTVVDRETYDEWLEAHAGEENVAAPTVP